MLDNRRGRALGLLAAGVLLVGAAEALAKPLQVEDLYGRTLGEMTNLFPNVRSAEPGRAVEVRNWRGWDLARLSFNANGRLVGLSLMPLVTLSAVECSLILRKELGIELPNDRKRSTTGGLAYRGLEGKVRTVNLQALDPSAAELRIRAIDVFFDLGWND